MKANSIALILTSLVIISAFLFPTASSGANELLPVQTFTGTEFPQPSPGKNAFAASPSQWCSAITASGQWVYAACGATGYILCFSRDTAIAQLTYVGATAYVLADPSGMIDAFYVRRNPGKSAMLYLMSGGDAAGMHPLALYWYEINETTGALTLKGQSAPDCHIGYQALRGDSAVFYQKIDATTIGWFGYDSNGAPVEKGRVSCTSYNYDYMVVSKDGRNLYRIDAANGFQIFKCDSATGAASPDTSLNLTTVFPPAPYGWVGLVPMSPDDRHLYLFAQDNNNLTGNYYCILERNTTTGRLIVPASDLTAPAQMTYQAGPPWSGQDRLFYNKNGKSGYFINLSQNHAPSYFGKFNRDSVTGSLTVASSIPASSVGAERMVYDPSCGNLYTIGDKICAYKMSLTGSAVETSLPASAGDLEIGPNPCNNSATIRFSVEVTADVHAAVYGVNGALIRTLVNRKTGAGAHSIAWNGHDAKGRSVPAGVYVVRAEIGTRILQRSLCLVK